jgi:hypothetical protein
MADIAKAVINLATGFEDAERVTVASFVGGAAVERGAPSASAPASWTRVNSSRRAARRRDTLWEWIGDDGATVFSN